MREVKYTTGIDAALRYFKSREETDKGDLFYTAFELMLAALIVWLLIGALYYGF